MAAQRVHVHELERQRDALEAALWSEQRLQEAEHGNPRAGVSRLRLELGALHTELAAEARRSVAANKAVEETRAQLQALQRKQAERAAAAPQSRAIAAARRAEGHKARLARVQAAAYISPYLPISPHVSPCLPVYLAMSRARAGRRQRAGARQHGAAD